MHPAIRLADVSKRFNGVAAVDALTLDVPQGSIYGFIGPNGSGKTTTLRMIMHILLPDAGRIEVLGQTYSAGRQDRSARADGPSKNAIRDRVSYLPEERGLYKKMTVRRLLRYYGQLKGRSIAEVDPVVDDWCARLGMQGWGEKKIETLSKGMSQKVQFVGAVVSKPDLLILDEPFSGLDPVNAEALKDAVLEMRRRGTTVVFSTHDMTTAERMCDRIFMIFRGRKVLDGTLEDIQAQYGFDTIRVRSAAGAAALAGMPGVQSVNDYGQLQEIRLAGDPQQFLQALAARTRVDHFEIARPSLHDIFVRIARPAESDAVVAPLGAE
jgi:ABC-2 type transport system ATP-binding protein